jgi:farnesyl-diphosphate farnesyltransferase
VRPPGPAARGDLLRDVLPGVSRSFALSLRVLPAGLRVPFGVTYLVARAADTVADTAALPPGERAAHVEAIRRAVAGGDAAGLDEVAARVAPGHDAREGRLLERLPDVLAAYRALPPADRVRAQGVLLTLTGAMLEALARFPPETAGRVEALPTRADLDRYTYGNAGCVGEFWTDMVAAHRRACAGWDLPRMRALAVRFGQGLQLVNVLRDLPRDLAAGRCFLPREDLAACGLAPEALRDPATLPHLRPLLGALQARALDDLGAGRAYTLAVPRREARLRLASAWPLLLGLATLARLRRADNLLDPAVVVKVPRSEVRGLLLRSAVVVASNRGLGALADRLAAAARG